MRRLVSLAKGLNGSVVRLLDIIVLLMTCWQVAAADEILKISEEKFVFYLLI
jgi:hypothetical protein